jgi:hypothetical protein
MWHLPLLHTHSHHRGHHSAAHPSTRTRTTHSLCNQLFTKSQLVHHPLRFEEGGGRCAAEPYTTTLPNHPHRATARHRSWLLVLVFDGATARFLAWLLLLATETRWWWWVQALGWGQKWQLRVCRETSPHQGRVGGGGFRGGCGAYLVVNESSI